MTRLTKLAIVIAAGALTAAGQLIITTKSPLPTAAFGQPYTAVTLATTGDPGPIQWSFVSGSIPTGFVVGFAAIGQPVTSGTFCYGFNTQSGPPLCTGPVQTFPAVYDFVLQAMSLSTGQTTTQQFRLAVVQALQIVPTPAPPNAQAGQPYSSQLLATGGTGQFTWSILSGTLPPGITLDPVTALLSGTAPGASGSYPFTVQVLDQVTQLTATQLFTINILGGLTIDTTALPDATVNKAYSFQLLAEEDGIANPALVWSFPVGSHLPTGFALSPSGVLTGFGQNTGTFSFAIQVTDPQQEIPPVASKIFSLNITLGTLGIKEASLPNANQNVPYRATLTPVGGIPPYTWTLAVPKPAGFSINASTGLLTGTPATAGTIPIPVNLTDSIGTVFSETFQLNVFAAVSITTVSLPNGAPSVGYGATLTATGGSIPYTWSVSAGSLPPGLNLNATTGQISGSPTTQGAFQFTVQVTEFGGGIATKVFTVTIGQGLALSITTTSLAGGTINQPYSQTLAAVGGTAPYTWSVSSGALPAGLQLGTATGVISGTPTSVGNFNFDVLVTDALQAVGRKSFIINIASGTNPVVITSGDFNGVVLSTFSQTLTASGGTSPYTWSISSGTLPSGLQLNSATGVISGTPSAFGASQLIFTATDANGQTGSKTITITVILPPSPIPSVSLGSTTQPSVSLSTNSPYPLEITGVLTLTFASSVGGTDNMVGFASSGRSLQFTVPVNTTQAVFPPGAAIITGTVAGTITLTASLSAGGQIITPGTPPLKTITIDPAVPVISSVVLTPVTGGLNVVVTGYSNTREVSSGSFTFTVSGANPVQVTVPLTTAYATWFGSTASSATGGQFKLTVPFSVTQGTVSAITKVSVTLTNSKGASLPASSP
jgi:hypothetical protein